MSFPHLQQAFHRQTREKPKYFVHNKIVYGKTCRKICLFSQQPAAVMKKSAAQCLPLIFSMNRKSSIQRII